MPLTIIEKIVENSDFKEQLILRKVSRDLREIVDGQKISCESIQVVWQTDHVKCRFDNQTVLYSKKTNIKCNDENVIRVVDNDYMRIAFTDWTFPLKNPKLKLKSFIFECCGPDKRTGNSKKAVLTKKYFDQFEAFLKSLNHKISVEKLEIISNNPELYQIMSVLPYLKPGVLKSIRVPGYDLNKEDLDLTDIVQINSDYMYRRAQSLLAAIEKIVECDQWKQAEELHLKHNWDYIPDQHLAHFKKFHITDVFTTSDKMIHLRKIFSESENFESCSITSTNGYDFSINLDAIGQSIKTAGMHVLIYHYRIPNSNKFLEFKAYYRIESINIVKKNL
ncbi:hypothetical protein GCK72_019890 [Caenorhabditis remanei]|uniref:F-box domain-containing protein n=1 Tax=Caenorhabditis remanei TaxID=31234 RepID=A0A6A5GF16_CAERE|nr:hypothetical protein GCK72_019890 [Caenorhabditis remanei]KAF1753334.1 hypothetical protein GCK72_019890 [Caenorhabditis remanei]